MDDDPESGDMSNTLSKYNVNAAWDDPFERGSERRQGKRHRLMIRISLAVEGDDPVVRMTGPCVVQDISSTGLWALTKHRLHLGQTVSIAIPTAQCPTDLFLPEAFVGGARVVRVAPIDDSRSLVALALGDAFLQNMEFAMFVDYIGTLARSIG